MIMNKLIFTILSTILPFTVAMAPQPPRYVVATAPTPVLNTPDFHKYFSGKIALDPCKGVRPIEFIALPGTLFTIKGEQVDHGVTIYRVTSNDYPYPSKSGYFIDSRFVERASGMPTERPRLLPPRGEVLRRLEAALGKPYVWGGNVKEGVPLLRELYPQADPLAGVDCSGLLYEATHGFTLRNTSALTSFGTAVPVAGLSAQLIAQKLQPLDLLVYKGHVMIVLDHDSIIQSTMGCGGEEFSGVHIDPLTETLRQLMKHRHPVDQFPAGVAGKKAFVVRRWYPAQLLKMTSPP
jgi:hypothetical protein